MNVLLINCILYSSSTRTITRRESVADCLICDVARGFLRLGHTVTVLAAEDYKPLRDENLGFRIVFLKSALKHLLPPALPWLPGLRGWLKRHGNEYDLIVSSEMLSLATLTVRRVCPQHLLVWHELAIKPRALFKLPAHVWYGLVVPLFMRKCRVVARSHEARRFLMRQGVKHVSPVTVEHGVDEQVFVPAEVSDNVFVTIARLVEVKRVDHIIQAFARLVQRSGREHFRLAVVGDGPLRQHLRSLADNLGVGHAVEFTGQIGHSRLAGLLNKAIALLVSPARDNNLVSIVEAVASGTPVLTNSVPSNAAAIKQWGLGIVADDWDADHLEVMIQRREEFHKACIAHRQAFTSTGCAQALINTFGDTSWQESNE